jgi:fatty-acyl-CoA synthase
MNAPRSHAMNYVGAPEPKFSVAKAWMRALKATSELGEHSTLTLPAAIEEKAVHDGDAVAVLSADSRMSYQQLAYLANRYARWALDHDVRVGDVVAILKRNSPEYIAVWLGVTRIGGIVALLNSNLRGEALAHCISTARPKHAIVDAELLPAYRSAESFLTEECRLWVSADSGAGEQHIESAIERYPGGRLRKSERRSVTLSHKALLIYTSGTTGLPKAANVSHLRIMAWSRWFSGMLDVRASDRMYDCLPLYHSVGGIVATGAMLVSGASLVVREKFSAAQFWRDVVEMECTLFQYIGELCRYLVNSPPSEHEAQHKLRLCCGNGMRLDVWENFKERFRIPHILEFYAATEGNFSLFNVEGMPGAIGRVPPFLSHRFAATLIKTDVATGDPIRGPDGLCVKVDVNEVGEAIGRVQIDGNGMVGRFEGYTSSSETERKILRNVFAAGDVWFRTGDLMRLDQKGYYHFVDRVGDTFRWKGENVSTSEVEDRIATFPGVESVAVYGVKIPGCEGRAGMAALVVKPGLDFAALHDHVAVGLPEYARPLFLRICPDLEMTETFKQKNKRLIEEGYDPEIIADELYFDDRVLGHYVRLDVPLRTRIEEGQVRL